MIATGGLRVFPRLVAAESRNAATARRRQHAASPGSTICSAADSIAARSTLFIGPAGAGKSAIATQYRASRPPQRGEHVAMYLFDEGLETFRRRAAGLGADVEPHVDSGRIVARRRSTRPNCRPGNSPTASARAVDRDHASVVVIDSLNGYLNAMPEERFLLAQLHELFMFLRQRGVVAISIVAQHGLVGQMQAPVDLSYLADNVVLLRFFEANGEVRQAISVLKKRSGAAREDHPRAAAARRPGSRSASR